MDWIQYYMEGVELLFLGIGTCLDVKDRMLPQAYFLLFGIAAAAGSLFLQKQSSWEMLSGCLPGILVLLAGFLTKEAIGYGDGLGILILGMFLGWKEIVVVLIRAFFLSGIGGLGMMGILKKTKKERLPFYPFLLLAFARGLIG